MWDLKLSLIDILFSTNNFVDYSFKKLFNLVDPFTLGGIIITNFKIYYQFTQNSSFFFAIKFLAGIGFLILVRGGTPRYRYDYLTKLGWLKFIGLVITVFFSLVFLFFIF